MQIYTKRMTDKIANAGNNHEKLNVLNEMLEGILDSVRPPQEEFKDIDTRPKHLLHMTDEDMQPKSPEVLREELNELIKEAKTKIKPVLMSQMEQEKYILTKEQASKKDLIDISSRSNELLDTENITLEILRKI